jgi:hypothetical protein
MFLSPPARRRGALAALATLLATLFAALPPLHAAESPSSGGASGEPIQIQPNLQRDAGTGNTNLGARGEPIGVFVQGSVQDGNGRPLSGARIQLFDSGALIARATTSPEGTFEISAPSAAASGESVDLWVLSPDPSRWVDERIVVVSGDSKVKRPLVPACTPVINLLGGSADVEVRMASLAEKQSAISKSRCLEERAGG